MSEHPFVSGLRRALTADARVDVELALRVATLRARGFDRARIAEITGATPGELGRAYARLERVREAR